MKKIILGLTIGLLLISCSTDSSSSSNVFKWKFKIDGVLYEWSGNQLTNPEAGGCTFASGTLAMSTTSSAINAGGTFPSISTGTFTMTEPNNVFTVSIDNVPYATIDGATISITVTSLSPNTYASNPTNPGKVIGTFSGTVKSLGGQTKTITEGSFEAMRAN